MSNDNNEEPEVVVIAQKQVVINTNQEPNTPFVEGSVPTPRKEGGNPGSQEHQNKQSKNQLSKLKKTSQRKKTATA